MTPDHPQHLVDQHPYHRDSQEDTEDVFYGLLGLLIDDVFASSFVYELEHLTSGHHSVSVRDTPTELLYVGGKLLTAHQDSHLWLGDSQVGCRVEAEETEQRLCLRTEIQFHKESRVLRGADGSLRRVELHRVVVLFEELAVSDR